MRTLIHVVYSILMIYAWMIIARAVFSWFTVRPGGVAYKIKYVLFRATEPYLKLFRRVIPVARFGNVGFDLSAVVGLIVLFIVMELLMRL